MQKHKILIAGLAMLSTVVLAADGLWRQAPHAAAPAALSAPPRQPAGGSLGRLAPAMASGALHRLDRPEPQRLTAEIE